MSSYPPYDQTWGNGALWVSWTYTEPYLPYTSAFFVDGWPFAWQNPNEAGNLGPDGTFAFTAMPGLSACDKGVTVSISGAVPLPSASGAFPDEPATVQWQWPSDSAAACSVAATGGPLSLPRDVLGYGG